MSGSISQTCRLTSGMHLPEQNQANAIAEIGELITK